MEMKNTRDRDRLEHEFNEEKRQLKKSLDRDIETRREDIKRECEAKYNKIINDLEREKARLLGRLERERGEVRMKDYLKLSIYYVGKKWHNRSLMGNLHHRLIFYLGKKKEIPGKNLLKVVKFQKLVTKCCKIRKI